MNKKQIRFFSTGFSLILFFFTLFFVIGDIPIIDLIISSKIVNSWESGFDNIFIFLGIFLKSILVFIALIFISFLYKQKRKKESLILLVSLLLGYFLENMINLIIQRERPSMQLIENFGYSFPSGHAVFSIILFSLLIYFYKDEIKNKFFKNLFILTNIFLILLVGLSRIYLNVHWFTDVIGGFFLGLFVTSLILNLEKSLAKSL
ncbi:MAG: phosphatase PAP2 family protein [Candidatus Pacearchaeota archaeon]